MIYLKNFPSQQQQQQQQQQNSLNYFGAIKKTIR